MNNKAKLKKHQALDLGLKKEAIPDYVQMALQILQDYGYSALLVGGCNRDMLLGIHPKDFDIATNASPEQVKRCFKRADIIGRRFIIVHAYIYGKRIEITTFRKEGETDVTKKSFSKFHQDSSKTSVLLSDNEYGNQKEDALRRDFSCNALYYDVNLGVVYDYFEGVEDIKNLHLKVIGDPLQRFTQDPVRMLRLIRFMAKFNFTCDAKVLEILEQQASLLKHVSNGRLYDEVNKLIMSGRGVITFDYLDKFRMLPYLLSDSALNYHLQHPSLIQEVLTSTDDRIAQKKPVIPAYFYALFLWNDYQRILSDLNETEAKLPIGQRRFIAEEKALAPQLIKTSMVRRVSNTVKEIWQRQVDLEVFKFNKSIKLLEDKRFRAAYDMYVVRTNHDNGDQRIADFWTHIQTLEKTDQKPYLEEFLQNNPDLIAKSKNKKRRKPKRKDK